LGGERVGTGFSPFTAQKYRIDLNLKDDIVRIEEGKKTYPFSPERN
jgi:hypothetical protein